ncbi:MAG: hypothetical protein ACE5JT_00990 [Nitrosopumilaceae archaeon]
MKKFSEIKVGDEYFAECEISSEDQERYLIFSGIKNVFLEKQKNANYKIISGRAILARLEGEFTRLHEMYGNLLILYGMDGEPSWKNRHARFLKPLYAGEKLRMKFKISEKTESSREFGLLAVDFEGSKENGDLVVVAKRNLYQIKKEPLVNQ